MQADGAFADTLPALSGKYWEQAHCATQDCPIFIEQNTSNVPMACQHQLILFLSNYCLNAYW
jgi:hypothetical protein